MIDFYADGERNPDDIPRIVRPTLQNREDLLFGKRPSTPRLSKILINKLARLRIDVTDIDTGCRAFNKSLAHMVIFNGIYMCV